MNFNLLRARLVEKAIQGKLVPQLDNEPEVEQIGDAPEEVPFEIPNKWKWVQIRHVIEKHIGGGTPSKSEPNYWKGNIPWATVKDLTSDLLSDTQDFISELGLNNSATHIIPTGSLIVCMRMAVGKIVINTIDVAINQDLRALIPKTILNKNYFVNVYKALDFKGSGTTVKGIKTKDLLDTFIPLPPLEEQKRIVEKLNQSLNSIDRAKKAYEELQKLSKVLKDKVLEAAIQGKLVPQLDNEPEVEQIGDAPEEVPFEIPSKWKWVLPKNLYRLISGRDLSKSDILETNDNTTNLFPYITGASQISNENILVNRWTKSCVVKSKKGDLLLTCKGTVGKTAFNDIGDIHIARQIMALRPYEGLLLNEYLKIFIDNLSKTLTREAKSMIPGIDRKTILAKVIPLPPLEEQKRIVEKLNELMKLQNSLQAQQ